MCQNLIGEVTCALVYKGYLGLRKPRVEVAKVTKHSNHQLISLNDLHWLIYLIINILFFT